MYTIIGIKYLRYDDDIYRSLLLEKSNEIIRLKQDNDKYKQRAEKYAQEIKDRDKEITGIIIRCT